MSLLVPLSPPLPESRDCCVWVQAATLNQSLLPDRPDYQDYIVLSTVRAHRCRPVQGTTDNSLDSESVAQNQAC